MFVWNIFLTFKNIQKVQSPIQLGPLQHSSLLQNTAYSNKMIMADLSYYFELTKDNVFYQYCGEINHFITELHCISFPMQVQVLHTQVMAV